MKRGYLYVWPQGRYGKYEVENQLSSSGNISSCIIPQLLLQGVTCPGEERRIWRYRCTINPFIFHQPSWKMLYCTIFRNVKVDLLLLCQSPQAIMSSVILTRFSGITLLTSVRCCTYQRWMWICTLTGCRRAFFFADQLMNWPLLLRRAGRSSAWSHQCCFMHVPKEPVGMGMRSYFTQTNLLCHSTSWCFSCKIKKKNKNFYVSFKNGLEVVLEVGQSWQSSVGLLGSDIVAINFIRDSVASSPSYRVKLG